MLEILLRWWQQLYGKGVLCNLSLNGTCQFAKTFTPLKQQLYIQIIHAETKQAILSNENKQMEVAFTHIHKRCAERYMTS